MAQIIRILLAYPALYLLRKIVQRFWLFAFLTVSVVTMFFAKDYVTANFISPPITEPAPTTQKNLQENITKEVTIKKGETLSGILRRQNLPNNEIQSLIKLAQSEKITSKLKIGQVFIFHYDIEFIETPESDLNKEQLSLNRMVLKIDKIKSIEFVRQDDKFVVHHIESPLKKLITQYETTIDSSFMSSLQKAGMSTTNIVKLINAYSHQIDFQRQIKSGDKITVLAEKFITDANEFSHHGEVLYASLKTQKNEYNIYNYSTNNKPKDAVFFTDKGNSIKSTLLRTPVNVVRISSHFGYRKKHPVLGYGAMHKGVDFAAAVGTPIYAAGDGDVEFVGWKSGYGRFILIKHNRTLSTAYAHASKFSKNLKRGDKIKQGDIIAYVGKSGRVTGPHLHYEVRVNGKQVDPMKFKSTPGVHLAGNKLIDFQKHQEKIKLLSKKLTGNIEIPASDTNLF